MIFDRVKRTGPLNAFPNDQNKQLGYVKSGRQQLETTQINWFKTKCCDNFKKSLFFSFVSPKVLNQFLFPSINDALFQGSLLQIFLSEQNLFSISFVKPFFSGPVSTCCCRFVTVGRMKPITRPIVNLERLTHNGKIESYLTKVREEQWSSG